MCRLKPTPIATSVWRGRSRPWTESVTAEERRALAQRYLGAEGGDLYIAATADQTEGSVAFRMTPEHWRTSDYGKVG